MKAVVLTGVRAAELREVPDPSITAPDEVLLRTAVAGICGSDLHYFLTDTVAGERVPYPLIAGHECSAVVEKTGTAVRRFKPGDRVAVEPALSCGECDQCLAGRPHTCRRLRFLGHPGEKDGGFSEFIVMPERNLLPLPPSLTLSEAMLAEPLSIALHTLRLGAGKLGPASAVLGTGTIGLCVILGLRAEGVREIYAADKSDARVRAALRAGAAWAANPERLDISAEILARQPLGLDAVFEASGDPATVEQAIGLVKPGGRIFQIGIPVIERVSYPLAVLRRKEISLQNVRRQNRCLERALTLIEARHIDVGWLATHDFLPDEAQRAFETAADRADGVIKAAFRFV